MILNENVDWAKVSILSLCSMTKGERTRSSIFYILSYILDDFGPISIFLWIILSKKEACKKYIALTAERLPQVDTMSQICSIQLQ